MGKLLWFQKFPVLCLDVINFHFESICFSVKGDGFPIANLIVILCTQVKDLVPIVTAHLFTICPTLIPSIPKSNVKEMSEDELMESLGMARKKDGEFETFERFLARTEVRSGLQQK